MKRLLPTSLLLLALIILAFIFVKPHTIAHSAANHVVISEIQISGSNADDEFVELYNPTSNSIDITGWRLRKQNSSGTGQNLVESMSGTIPPHGFYLVAKSDYDGSVTPDTFYSASSSALATNHTVTLFSDAGISVVDKVGFGLNAVGFETATFSANPGANGSIERKALVTSTSETMGIGGLDETMGNGNDTDDNSVDFVTREIADPQNSSVTENPNPPTSTSTPTNEPTATPTPTPTGEPTATPTPTTEPTATPTPTTQPTLTPTITPTATPTVTPTPTPFRVLGVFNFPDKRIVCGWIFKSVRFGFFNVRVPQLVCN